ncbi:YppE family protein [Bacillus sp. CGMCC 1.16541]|uniref:YppE family protein n=1 Tax=Bacillus sp. CGMCC 1.16541 TaxID=2185143 RepID=UPI000D729802|nr:YppE family protein [Bacillus sp. CGMCC 1.16541]
MITKSTVIELTEKLFVYNEKALSRLLHVHQTEAEADFYMEVKPYVDAFFIELDEWEMVTKKWIQDEKPKYIHLNQITSTIENLHNVVLQSFYKDTREKRFKQMYQANKYVLESILANE